MVQFVLPPYHMRRRRRVGFVHLYHFARHAPNAVPVIRIANPQVRERWAVELAKEAMLCCRAEVDDAETWRFNRNVAARAAA